MAGEIVDLEGDVLMEVEMASVLLEGVADAVLACAERHEAVRRV